MFNFSTDSFLQLGEVSEEELDWLAETLVPNEQVFMCYKSVRDSVVFTNYRVILRNVEGITGSAVETATIPYSGLIAYSVRTPGTLDKSASIALLVRESGELELKFVRKTNVGKIEGLLSRRLLAVEKRY